MWCCEVEWYFEYFGEVDEVCVVDYLVIGCVD